MMFMCNKHIVDAEFMKKINIEAGLKKSVVYKKNVYFSLHDDYLPFLYTAQHILINWKRSSLANLIYWPWATNLF